MSRSASDYAPEAIAYFRLKVLANALGAVLFGLLAIYLIVCKSCRSIGSYKWFLLNIAVCSLVYDVYFTIMFAPFPLMPTAGVCVTGAFAKSGSALFGVLLPTTICLELLVVCGISALNAVLYRLAAVYNRQQLLLSKRYVACLVVNQVAFGLPCFFAALYWSLESSTKQENLADAVLKDRPELSALLSSELCAFFDDTSMWLNVTVATGTAQAFMGIGMATLCWIVSVVALYRKKASMSARRFEVQRQFIFALAVQIAAPVITLVMPFILVMLSIALKLQFFEDMAQFAVQVATSHSVINAVIMIALTKQYRHAFIRMLVAPFSRQKPKTRIATATTKWRHTANVLGAFT